MNIQILHGRYQSADGVVLDAKQFPDTIGLDLSDERKAALLADFPEWFAEIEDEEAYLAGKGVTVAAPVVEEPPVVEEAATPSTPDPMTTTNTDVTPEKPPRAKRK